MPKEEVVNIELCKIVCETHDEHSKTHLREYQTRLVPLAYDMLMRGQIEPIHVFEKPNGYYVVSHGTRRIHAIHELIFDSAFDSDLTEHIRRKFATIKCIVHRTQKEAILASISI